MAAVIGYCCGFVSGTSKHQLWCALHPDRNKGKDMKDQVATKPPSNSEQAEIDDISKAIVQSIAEEPNVWRVTSDHKWFDRLRNGKVMRVRIDDGPRKIVIQREGAGEHLLAQVSDHYGRSTASQDAIWRAFKKWQEAAYLAHIAEKQDTWVPPPPQPWWKDSGLWWLVGIASVIVAAITIAYFAGASSHA